MIHRKILRLGLFGWLLVAAMPAQAQAQSPPPAVAPPTAAEASVAPLAAVKASTTPLAAAIPLTDDELGRLRQLAQRAPELLAVAEKESPKGLNQAAERAARYNHLSKGQQLRLGFKITLLGLVVVMSVLGLIAATIALLNRLEPRLHRVTDAIPPQPTPGLSEPGSLPGAHVLEEPDPVLAVVIAAALSAVYTHKPFRIRTIRLAEPVAGWSQAGRTSIMESHRLPHR